MQKSLFIQADIVTREAEIQSTKPQAKEWSQVQSQKSEVLK